MDIILKYFPDLTETQKNNLPRCTTCTLTGTAKSMSYHARISQTCTNIMCFTRWALPSLSSSSREHVSWTWAREVVFRAYRLLFYSPTQRFIW